MPAPPPDEPDGSRDPRDGDNHDLDFDAEFQRIISGWTPTDPSADPKDPSVEPQDPSADPKDPSVEPQDPSAEPVETNGPATPDDSLRNLFRSAWPDEEPDGRGAEPGDPEEHFVPPPAPPIPRPEPRRLLAWGGLVVAPILALLLLLVGSLPSYASFLLFSWFVGGFAYLVATMNDGGRDGWDDGAQI